MQQIKGVTLIETLIGFAGLGIFLLMVYALLAGGMKGWHTLTPQINARQISRDILYGKTGSEYGELINAIRECNMRIRDNSPTVGVPQTIITSLTACNFLTYYATGTLKGTVAICYEWKGENNAYTGYNLDESLSNIGTLTKIIWRLKGQGTSTWWGTPTSNVLASNIRMGSFTYNFGDAYPLFRYYDGLGVEIYDDKTTLTNELLVSINTIKQIGINMVFDIDNDGDKKYGEDPPDGKNQDGDSKTDEDRPDDSRIKERGIFMNLNRYPSGDIP